MGVAPNNSFEIPYYTLEIRYRLALIAAAVSMLALAGAHSRALAWIAEDEVVGLSSRIGREEAQCAQIGEMEWFDCEEIYFSDPKTGRPLHYGCINECAQIVIYLEPGRTYNAKVLRVPLIGPKIVRIDGTAESMPRVFWFQY